MKPVEYASPDTSIGYGFDSPSEMVLTPGIRPDELGVTPGLILPQNTPIPGDLGTAASTPIVQPADVPDDPILYEAPHIMTLDATATQGAQEALASVNTGIVPPATATPGIVPETATDSDAGKPETTAQKGAFLGLFLLVLVLGFAGAIYLAKKS